MKSKADIAKVAKAIVGAEATVAAYKCASVVVGLMFQAKEESGEDLVACHDFYLSRLIQDVEFCYSERI